MPGRERGADALRLLLQIVGEPSYDAIVAACDRRGEPLGKGTINRLLTGTGSPHPRSVRRFVQACLDLDRKRHAPRLTAARATVEYWTRASDRPQPTGRQQKLVRVGTLPMRAAAYQPRAVGDHPGEAKVVVLSGLGGVGKTQLAAGYARQAWEDPD